MKVGPVSKEACTLTHLAIDLNGAEQGMKRGCKNADVQRNVPFLVRQVNLQEVSSRRLKNKSEAASPFCSEIREAIGTELVSADILIFEF